MEHRSRDDQADPLMRWDGWGDPAQAKPLPRAARMLLPMLLGKLHPATASLSPSEVRIAPTELSAAAGAAFGAVVGVEHVDVSPEARLRHAGGKSTPDLLRRRDEPVQQTPDAVISPASHAEVRACLAVAMEHDIALIPFGGGTSVVGALDPERGPHRAVVSLNLRRLSGLISCDDVSAEAVLGAGTTGPEAEALLSAHGFELGHYPQSFRYATIGGFAAARSSGQNSAGYGRFDTMVTGIRVATPTGDIELGRSPGTAAGPDLIRLFLGSEGIFGIITEVRVRVHPVPDERVFEAWSFPNFAAGIEGLRQVAQHGTGPTVIRLSDEAETAVSLAQLGKIGKLLAKGASVVTVYEGEDIAHRRQRTAALLQAAGGVSSGVGAAEEWLSGRFDGPYLRDSLLDVGVFTETLETATRWSQLQQLRSAVGQTVRAEFAAAGAKCYVMCHISHLYPTGASLYFTILAGVRDDAQGVWRRVKSRVNDAILATGGTISHHHGVGRDHAAWLAQEVGETGIRILTAIKRELDPQGILNPGAVIARTEGSRG